MHNRSVVINIKTDIKEEEVRAERLQRVHHFISGIDQSTASSEFEPAKKTCRICFRFGGPERHKTIQVVAKLKPVGPDLYELEAKGETTDLTAFCQSHFPGQKPDKLFRVMFGESLKRSAKRHGSDKPKEELVTQA